MPRTVARPDARAKLLDAALSVIRTRGYSATTVDELCATAGVTKGAFFHHFKSKDKLAGQELTVEFTVLGRRFLFASRP